MDMDAVQSAAADAVLVLLEKDYRLSRNSRVQWYLTKIYEGTCEITKTPGIVCFRRKYNGN